MKSSRAKGSARLVLMVLATHVNDESLQCFPGRELLCWESAMEERNLIYALKQLEAIGELVITRGNGRGKVSGYQLAFVGQERVQDLVIGTPKKDAEISEKGCNPSQERVQDSVERVQDSVIKGAKSDDTYKEEPSVTIIEPSEEPKDMSGAIAPAVQEVFTYWQTALNHSQAKLTPKRKKLTEARLKERYTVEQLKSAIDGCRASPWHMGQNPNGTVWDDLTLICRDGEHVEMFIAKTTSNNGTQTNKTISRRTTEDDGIRTPPSL